MNTELIHTLGAKYFDSAVSIRRQIHQHPELAFSEENTAEQIKSYLTDLGCPFEDQIAKTGVIAQISGKPGSKGVLIRADMDALPITEGTGLSFASEYPGRMHACGHDAHVASLLLAGRMLWDLKDEFRGTVSLVFQPAEEGDGGAKPMIDNGILLRYPASVALAAHMMPEIPVGNVMIKSGPVMASPDDFEVTFYGKGGHGATPDTAVNSIQMGQEFLASLDKIGKSASTPDAPCVVSICSFHSGTCRNAIPETAVLSGTFRTLTQESRKKVSDLIQVAAKRIAKDFGGRCAVDMNLLYPPTINHPEVSERLKSSLSSLLGASHVISGERALMLGDDFAYFAQEIPSVYFHVGCGDDQRTAPIHSPHFDLNEDAIRVAAESYVAFILDYLK